MPSSVTKISRPLKIMNDEEYSQNEFYFPEEHKQAKLQSPAGAIVMRIS